MNTVTGYRFTERLARWGRALAVVALLVGSSSSAQTLYNGIKLPETWPPKVEPSRRPPPLPPYLLTPPEVINVTVGRQLFVDDFLVDSTTLTRTYHRPQYYAGNPVLQPDKPWEGKGFRTRATVFSDGVWFDPQDQLFKMWYWASATSSESPLRYDTCLAISRDGIRWEKPQFDVIPGTNIVLRDEEGLTRNSSTVWLDLDEKDARRRFKMFRVVQQPKSEGGRTTMENRIRISFSADGIHWTTQMDSDVTGDRSTVFYNPFRRVWVFSLRGGTKELGRSRVYCEFSSALPPVSWASTNTGRGKLPWIGADDLDADRSDLALQRDASRPWDLVPSQLYNLDGVAYESVMLGLFSIWRGQPQGRPKINEVCVGYSRDGFHWTRPDRRAFCGVSENENDWNWGNVQSAGGGCLVVGEKLYFYVGGNTGKNRAADPSQVGLATLRRDGFVSMDAGPEERMLTTRAISSTGRYLFVNVDAPRGQLRVEVLDRDGQVIEPYSRAHSVSVQGDSTRAPVRWEGHESLEPLAGRPVRFRFHLRQGSLYAFWVSPDEGGASGGYVAAGGPGFANAMDLPPRQPEQRKK